MKGITIKLLSTSAILLIFFTLFGCNQIFEVTRNFSSTQSEQPIIYTYDYPLMIGNTNTHQASFLINVKKLVSSDAAYAALRYNGSVITWGSNSNGGTQGTAAASLTSGVVKVYANKNAFAALKVNGSVITWGDAFNGGSSTAVASLLTSGVVDIYSTDRDFIALKSDGTVVTWGGSNCTPDPTKRYVTGYSSSVIVLEDTAGYLTPVCGEYHAGFTTLKAAGK